MNETELAFLTLLESSSVKPLSDEFFVRIEALKGVKPKSSLPFEVANKTTEEPSTWYDAIEYVELLGDGWRLPTIEELDLIYKSENDFEKEGYWSSTEFDYRSSWQYEFDSGIKDYYGKTAFCYVRAVKDN